MSNNSALTNRITIVINALEALRQYELTQLDSDVRNLLQKLRLLQSVTTNPITVQSLLTTFDHLVSRGVAQKSAFLSACDQLHTPQPTFLHECQTTRWVCVASLTITERTFTAAGDGVTKAGADLAAIQSLVNILRLVRTAPVESQYRQGGDLGPQCRLSLNTVVELLDAYAKKYAQWDKFAFQQYLLTRGIPVPIDMINQAMVLLCDPHRTTSWPLPQN